MITPVFAVCRWKDAWADATASVTLKDVDETHKAEIFETAGWLLRQDEDGISLANERCNDGSYRGRTFIPSGLILHVQEYKLAVPRKRKPKALDPA